jgi:hypothetical protein
MPGVTSSRRSVATPADPAENSGVLDDLTPVPVEGPLSEEEIDLFGPYRYLIPIEVEGIRMLVPENNSALRALQYLELTQGSVRLDWGRYCWNDTKGCCAITIAAQGGPVEVRACRTPATAGLSILTLPPGGRRCG